MRSVDLTGIRRFFGLALGVAVFALAQVAPWGSGRPTLPGGQWALILALLAAALAALYGAVRPAREAWRVVWLLVAFAALGALNWHWPNVGQIPSMFALGMLGGRLPNRWTPRLALPMVAFLIWTLQGGQWGNPFGTLTNAVGLLAIVLLGYSTHRWRVLSVSLARANRDLAEQAEQEGELSRLRERERLARELHDTLGHALSTLTVQIEAAKRLMPKDPARANAQLDDAQRLARGAMYDLRASLDDLRAAPRSGLHDTLQDLANDFARRNGWQLHLDVPDLAVPPQTAWALARAAREALVNVERHANARQVALCAAVEDGRLTLRVRDDGVGFDPAGVPSGHYGLRGMQERLALLGGALLTRSVPSSGTELTLSVPLLAVERPPA